VAISQQKIVENCEFARNCQFRFRHNTPRARADVIDHHPRLYYFSVQVDSAVELGPDDDRLEFPWEDPASACSYFDLKRQPELLARVPEAAEHPELRDFLARVNSPASVLETAKCDAWSTSDLNPEEDIFAAARKFGSYVDLLFSDPDPRLSFKFHEDFVRKLIDLLKKSPEIPASAEFLIRRCYFREANGQGTFGFYVSFYGFGYGEDEQRARMQWAIALKLVANAITQLSASTRE